MLLTELFDDRNNTVEMSFDAANYSNNSDQLTYRITNLPVNGQTVSDAGTVILDVDPEDFVRKVVEASSEGVQSIDNVKLSRPLQNFNCNSCSAESFDMDGDYTLSVAYTTNNGSQEVTQVTFDESTFRPSEEFARLTT